MRPGVIDLRGKASAIAHGERRLQRVVIRERSRLELVHVEERSARRREWSIVKRARGRDTRIHRLVDVAITEQLFPSLTDVANLEHAVAEQFTLNVEVVVLDVRRAQVG